MGNVCRKVSEEGKAENQFERLPDDVVLHILGKLSDVKWLCRCFVVEKRFASLVPLVQTVSFDTKTWNSFFSNQDGPGYVEGSCFKRIFSDFLIENLIPAPQLRFPHLVFHFKHIRSLNIEHPSIYNYANNDSIFKWGANIIRNPESLTFLTAASLSKPDEEKHGQETGNEVLDRSANLFFDCVQKARLWHATLGCAVKTCLMLRSITITDSKNKGVKLFLSGEKLVEYRKICKIMELTLEEIASWRSRPLTWAALWYGEVPVLQLPVSGYVMKGVTLVHITASALDAFDGTAMLDDFAEEKGVFSEAVVQIFEKHRKEVFSIRKILSM